MALESFASVPSEHLRARLGFDPRILLEGVVARAAAVTAAATLAAYTHSRHLASSDGSTAWPLLGRP